MLIKATPSTSYYPPFSLMHITAIQAENEQAFRPSLACKWSIGSCITPCIWKQLVCRRVTLFRKTGVFPYSFSTAKRHFPPLMCRTTPNPNGNKTETEEQAKIRKQTKIDGYFIDTCFKKEELQHFPPGVHSKSDMKDYLITSWSVAWENQAQAMEQILCIGKLLCALTPAERLVLLHPICQICTDAKHVPAVLQNRYIPFLPVFFYSPSEFRYSI